MQVKSVCLSTSSGFKLLWHLSIIIRERFTRSWARVEYLLHWFPNSAHFIIFASITFVCQPIPHDRDLFLSSAKNFCLLCFICNCALASWVILKVHLLSCPAQLQTSNSRRWKIESLQNFCVFSELTKMVQVCPLWEDTLAIEDPVFRTGGRINYYHTSLIFW